MDIEVFLPNGKKEMGDVDPSASIEEIKADIVKAFANTIGSNDPNSFHLLMGPTGKNRPTSLAEFNPLADAVFYLITKEKLRGNAFTPKPSRGV